MIDDAVSHWKLLTLPQDPNPPFGLREAKATRQWDDIKQGDVLKFFDDPAAFPDLKKFAMIGFGKLNGFDNNVRAYTSTHVYSAYILNLRLLQNVEFDKRLWWMEDISFNREVSSQGLVICKCQRFHFDKPHLAGGAKDAVTKAEAAVDVTVNVVDSAGDTPLGSLDGIAIRRGTVGRAARTMAPAAVKALCDAVQTKASKKFGDSATLTSVHVVWLNGHGMSGGDGDGGDDDGGGDMARIDAQDGTDRPMTLGMEWKDVRALELLARIAAPQPLARVPTVPPPPPSPAPPPITSGTSTATKIKFEVSREHEGSRIFKLPADCNLKELKAQTVAAWLLKGDETDFNLAYFDDGDEMTIVNDEDLGEATEEVKTSGGKVQLVLQFAVPRQRPAKKPRVA